MLRRYLKNTSFMLVERVLRIGVNLFLVVYVARYLGPKEFGGLSYAQSLVTMIFPIAGLGIESIVVKEFVDKPKQSVGILWTVFWLRLFSGVVSIGMLFVILWVFDLEGVEKTLVAVLSISLALQSLNIIELYFQSIVKSIYIVEAQVVQLLVSVVVRVILVWWQMDLVWFAMAIVADYLVFGVALVFNYWRVFFRGLGKNAPGTGGGLDFGLVSSLLRRSLPMIVSGIAVTVYMKIDQVMIGEMLGQESVGIYAAASRVSEAWYFIPMVIVTSIFPALVEVKNKTEYEVYFLRMYSFLVWMGVFVAVPFSYFSGEIMLLLFGDEYSASGDILAIHVWTGIFVALGLASGKRIVIDGSLNYSMYRTVVGVSVNIVCNYFLILWVGVVGAAIATLVSQVLAGYLVDILFKSARRDFFVKTKSFVFPLILLSARLSVMGRDGRRGR